jgi:Ca-activated chloride channel family protein
MSRDFWGNLTKRARRGCALFLAAMIAAAGAGPLPAARALAQSSEAPAEDETGSGSLLLVGKGDTRAEAVRLGTDVQITVSGTTARARVTQAFRNTTGQWVEAVYLYPLPQDAAVDSLKMVVGNRVIVGEIKERQKAREDYEAAKASGRRAALVEQQRPNMFTNSVANVGPGETVIVQIEYQQPVQLDAGRYSLRLPLVVAPRYTQGGQATADRDLITAPILDPRVYGKANPVTITVRLNPGFELGSVDSPYHRIDTQAGPDGGRVITLADGKVPANRDFVLNWTPAASATPGAALFRERVGGEDYLLAMVTPPAGRTAARRLPRETVFVIDNSGSMGGSSMRQAKASLDYALSRLRPDDRFNLIRFDDTLTTLWDDTVPATAENVRRARDYVRGLEAAGGTEMLPAMQAALQDPRPSDDGHVRQVVFLTDGEIGDEAGMLAEIGSNRGRSRIFMVGIGSAPNSFLMTRAAELGRGAFTHIGSVDEVDEAMRALFNKLESPVAIGLTARFSDGADADVTPAILPDLYAGEPVVLAARVKRLKGSVTLSATIDGQPWSVTLPLADAIQGEGISKLWARRMITDAEVARSLGRIDDDEADRRILKLGLDHHLVTSLTSLVAIDRTPARPKGTPLTRADIPLDLPAGWDVDAWFGKVATDAPAEASADQPPPALDLPQTATDARLLVLIGAGLLLLAALVARRRRGAA